MPKKSVKNKELEHEYLEFKGFLSFLILHELSLKSMSGDDLAVRIGKRKEGTLTPGTIYPALKKLRLKKLIKYKKFGRKKLYSLTETGVDELKNMYSLFSKYFLGLKKFIKRN